MRMERRVEGRERSETYEMISRGNVMMGRKTPERGDQR